MSPRQVEELVAGLEGEDQTGRSTAYLPPGAFQRNTHPFSAASENTEDLAPFLSRIEGSPTGAVAFWGPTKRLVVLPPFPPKGEAVLPGTDAAPLLSQLSAKYLVAVVLLRLGRYAVGVFRGAELLSSKTGGRYVKSAHSAGGWSQKRFQRIRENQTHHLYQGACQVIERQLDPYDGQLDWIFLGGEKFTLQGLVKECRYLQRSSHQVVGRILNVREPKERTLVQSINLVYQSSVLVIR